MHILIASQYGWKEFGIRMKDRSSILTLRGKPTFADSEIDEVVREVEYKSSFACKQKEQIDSEQFVRKFKIISIITAIAIAIVTIIMSFLDQDSQTVINTLSVANIPPIGAL